MGFVFLVSDAKRGREKLNLQIKFWNQLGFEPKTF